MINKKHIFITFLLLLFITNRAFAQSGEIPVDPKVLLNVVKVETFQNLYMNRFQVLDLLFPVVSSWVNLMEGLNFLLQTNIC